MPETLNCPNCGAPIDYHAIDEPTVRCPFCSASVIIPVSLRGPKAPEPRPQPAPEPAPFQPSSTPVLDRLRDLASQTTDHHELHHIAREERRILRHQLKDEEHRRRHGG